MIRTSRSRNPRRCIAGQLTLGLLAFFFTASMKVRENGVGKITLVYPAAQITTLDIERRRYDSATTKATGLQLDHGVARVRMVFEDLSRLSEAPEFRNTSFTIEPGPDGTARLHAAVRATVMGDVISDGLASIRLTLPGPVIDSNAQESSGTQAMWSVPVTRYFKGGIELDATYRTPAAVAGGSQPQAPSTDVPD